MRPYRPRGIRDRWTAAREAWLRTLRDKPGTRRARCGPVGFQCMRLGWTAWDRSRTRPGALMGELLTDEGHAVLAKWESGNRT